MTENIDAEQLEIIQEFVQECLDLTDELEPSIMDLGHELAAGEFTLSEENTEIINAIFRLFHSMKGGAGFLELENIATAAHAAENLLDEVRKANMPLQIDHIDLLCSACDFTKAALADVAEKLHDHDMETDAIKLAASLKDAIAAGMASPETTATDGNDPEPIRIDLSDPEPEVGKSAEKQADEDSKVEPDQEIAPPSPLSEEPPPKVGEILMDKDVVSEDVLEEALALQQRPIGEVLIGMGAASPEEVDVALTEQAKTKKAPDETPESSSAKPKSTVKRQDIRVDLGKLDTLIDLIGEMVIAENMLIHSPDLEGLELDNFQKSAQQMSKLVKELQEVAVTIRMIPVAGLFRRMTRLVHDLSRKSGKKVDLQLVGVDTELDKTVIETITDPLVHLIRNSMDHGLEPPAERKAGNKPETGILKLSACHEEGEVWITIEDDGRGLNRKKILAKAVANGIIEGDGADLSDREIANMIFLPGFSTAEKITDVSGRGVGMDVVRQNLNKINGKIDVDSRNGGGTRTDLRIPLTMAIIEGMLIRVGSTKYIMPILPIRESLRPDPKMITIGPDGSETVMIRKLLYPVLRLHDIHKIEPDNRELHEGILLLLEDQKNTFCLFVDQIMGQQQTVMKGLSEYLGKLRDVKAVSGCTILADGEVCLILDVGGLSADAAQRRAQLN